MILAIDPGTEESGWVLFDGSDRPIQGMGIEPNADVLHRIYAAAHGDQAASRVVIEMIASYGMAVGKTTFETVCWIGRFANHATLSGLPVSRIYKKGRDGICMHLCHDSRAKDKNIRRALIDRYGPSKSEAIGLKATPGPLYGVKSHIWAALAVAVTAWDDPGKMEKFPD